MEKSKIEDEIRQSEDESPGPMRGLYEMMKTGVTRSYFRMLLYAYYREVDVIGIENVPRTGPVIFCGNHQNQFVDGVMLYAHCPRIPSFIIAAKSMGRQVVGDFARFMNCIPVRRPQDEAVAGPGVITSVTETHITGMHTKFTSIPGGSLISISLGGASTLIVKLMNITSDTAAEIKEISTDSLPEAPEGRAYKIFPKIDQKEMWQSVYARLGQGGCIGIFPEGGSHDQTSMIGMKDGIARIALGSIEHGNQPPVIIPVGLTYYYGHRFRSRAHIEFGKPLYITDDMYKGYQEDKAAGVVSLMQELQAAMAEVTIQCPDWRTLKQVHHVRRLYQPGRIKLDVAEYLRTTRRFAQGLRLVEDLPAAKALLEKLELYQENLKAYLLTDHQVQSLDTLQSHTSYKLVAHRMFMTAFWFLLCITGVVINLPVGVIARVYSDVKSMEAVKNSTVKVLGNDVKASYKVLCAMMLAPFYIMMYVVLAWWYYSFGLAVVILIVYPLWSYWSVVWANNCMCAARATFPLLLSLHSENYMSRFNELHNFRKELVADVRQLVDVHVRGKHDLWSSRSEELYQRIEALDSIPPTEETQNMPFTVEHTSRLEKRAVSNTSFSSSAKSE